MGSFLLRFTCLFLFLANLQVRAAEEARHILIVHSFGRDYAPFHDLVSQFRADLAFQSPEPVEFLEASLEMARFEGKDQEDPLVNYLAAVFKERAPDLIVPVGAPAAGFCQKYRGKLFPKTPMLVVGIGVRRVKDLILQKDIVTACSDTDLKLIFQNIVQILPKTKHVFVVMGTSPLERFWESELKREWPPIAGKIEFHWLAGESVDEMERTLSAAPADSAVVAGILSRDGAGIPYEHESALVKIHQKTRIPIFGYTREQLGQGIVGGRLLSMKNLGTDAAKAALRLLAGESAANIHVEPQRMGEPVYDWRELKRWKISESMLPAGSTILYREPSLWEAHRTTAIIAVAVTLFQAGLIALLLITRGRARETDATLSLAADVAHVGLWRRNLVTDEVEVSPQMRIIFEIPMEGRVVMEDLIRRIHPEDEERVRRKIAGSAKDGKGYEMEYRILLPGGETRWVISIGRSETGQDRRHARGIALDITERKQAEMELGRQRDQLVHLSRVASLGVLSGSLAHEINQPLGIILSNAQAAQRMLEKGSPDLVELKEILSDIVSEDRRAGDVIRRLRALVQQGETTRHEVDINEVVQDVLRLLRSDLFLRKFAVNFQSQEGLPTMQADRVQLQQVLLNLVVNACDAMADIPKEDRVLDLWTSMENGKIHIAIRDRGMGLPAEVESLFQPFHTTKPNGLGMGLAICRMLIDAHGGKIWAESNKDRGATFHVTLPITGGGI